MAAGLDPAAFWSVTPREALVILEGADARAAQDLKLRQHLAYATAILIATGVNNPKNFPKFGKVFGDTKARKAAQHPKDIWAAMSGWADAAQLAIDNERARKAN